MGRTRKIPMAKRETAEQRSVTFTKRRQGLFNKAADLCRICDAHIAIIWSPQRGPKKKFIPLATLPLMLSSTGSSTILRQPRKR
ncbi:hypothetical protein BDE02_06G227800 [Populus trichocarpa]|nr:hypothetical protein BDE02_06G227800 [Populus trichocarpa]